jgi:TDG/mug DNA glycosylase family protein
VDRPTVEVYEREGSAYAQRRGVQQPERAAAFADAVTGLRLDLGCGPGQYLRLLGRPAVALDPATAMVRAAAAVDAPVPVVQGEASHLPFGRHTFAGIWASKAHQHLPARELPMALAEAHRVLAVGGRLELTLFTTDDPTAPTAEEVSTASSGDDLPGRLFTWWNPGHLAAVVEAAGFEIDDLVAEHPAGPDHRRVEVVATAARALPDHVGPSMRLLCCGLNPSLHAADAGVGYVTASNRFWSALARAGLCDRDRDPRHLLIGHGIGMTDLVKRPTARADELGTEEYRAGLARLEALCQWLRPAAVVMVGLAGWRAAADRRAQPGWQGRRLGATPVYVMASTSGLNAGSSLDDLAQHLARAAAGP